MGAHDLPVVARNHVDSTVAIGRTTSRIRRFGIDGVVAGNHHRPAVIVELTREEERVQVAITFCRIVAVVLMNRDGMKSEATICGRIDRKRVVDSHHHRLSVTSFQQLGWEGAVKCPECGFNLRGKCRVKPTLGSKRLAIKTEQSSSVVVKSIGAKFTAVRGQFWYRNKDRNWNRQTICIENQQTILVHFIYRLPESIELE